MDRQWLQYFGHLTVLWSVLWKDKLDCAFELMCLVWIASYYTQWASNPIIATKSNCSHAKTCPHSLWGELVSGKGTTEVSEQAERPGFHFHSCNPQGWHANLSPVSSPGHRLDGQSWVGVTKQANRVSWVPKLMGNSIYWLRHKYNAFWIHYVGIEY